MKTKKCFSSYLFFYSLVFVSLLFVIFYSQKILVVCIYFSRLIYNCKVGDKRRLFFCLAGAGWIEMDSKKKAKLFCVFCLLFFILFFLFFAKIGRHTTTKRKNKHTHANYFFSLPPNQPKPELLLRV